MTFWQLTIDANDPAVLARFWAQALGYQPVPPLEPRTTWNAHYRAQLGHMEDAASVERRTRYDDSEDPIYYAVMHDPEGNEFCVG